MKWEGLYSRRGVDLHTQLLHHESNYFVVFAKDNLPLAYKMSYKYAVLFEERCGINGNDVIIRVWEDKGGTMASQAGHVK